MTTTPTSAEMLRESFEKLSCLSHCVNEIDDSGDYKDGEMQTAWQAVQAMYSIIQKPAAWRWRHAFPDWHITSDSKLIEAMKRIPGYVIEPLYTSPQPASVVIDDAIVQKALNCYLSRSDNWPGYPWQRDRMRAALEAALGGAK